MLLVPIELMSAADNPVEELSLIFGLVLVLLPISSSISFSLRLFNNCRWNSSLTFSSNWNSSLSFSSNWSSSLPITGQVTSPQLRQIGAVATNQHSPHQLRQIGVRRTPKPTFSHRLRQIGVRHYFHQVKFVAIVFIKLEFVATPTADIPHRLRHDWRFAFGDSTRLFGQIDLHAHGYILLAGSGHLSPVGLA